MGLGELHTAKQRQSLAAEQLLLCDDRGFGHAETFRSSSELRLGPKALEKL